jgi:prepilin-type N-terminal cleavage/methylation domain-containing protein
MKKEQGFSLVELLIVVAIIAIIAAIAVPSLLTSRMAANEASGIEGCRTAGSAEVAFASTNNAQYTTLDTLWTQGFLDQRFQTGFNGYTYNVDAAQAIAGVPTIITTFAPPNSFGIIATPTQGLSRFQYGIAPDQVVRYLDVPFGDTPPLGLAPGDGVGKMTTP